MVTAVLAAGFTIAAGLVALNLQGSHGLWLSVGSTNLDRRSFALNDEANLNITDRDFAERQIAIFQQDVARSKAITYIEWQQRPLVEKLIEHTASLLRTQL